MKKLLLALSFLALLLPAAADARSRQLVTISTSTATLKIERTWVEINCTNSSGCAITLLKNLPSIDDAKILCRSHTCTLIYATPTGNVTATVAVDSVAEVSYDGEGNWYLSSAVAANPTVTPTPLPTATPVPTATP